jgi:N-methylhydantoinase B
MDRSLRKLIAANVREAEVLLGDLEAQVAANGMAGKRLLELMREYEVADVEALYEEILTRSERSSREAIRAVPNGLYRTQVNIDGYDAPLTIALALEVKDDEIIADYSGSSPQSRKGINVCLNYVAGYTAFALRCAIARDIPNNHGSLAPIRVVAPEGTVVSAKFPAPVSARHVVGQMIPGVVLQALSSALPGDVIADGAGSVWAVALQGQSTDSSSRAAVIIASGGMGARPVKDGLTAMQYPTGTACVPIEVMELTAPLIYRAKEIVTDSGGPGKFRGGLGQRIMLEVISKGDPWLVNIMGDRTKFPPNGLFGGRPGGMGRLTDGSGVVLPSKFKKVVDASFTFVAQTPGGGGYGSPFERDVEAVRRDVKLGYVSVEAAERDYGVVLDGQGNVIRTTAERSKKEVLEQEKTRVRAEVNIG